MADPNLFLSQSSTSRLLRALVADEWGRIRGKTVTPEESASWDDALIFDEDGLGSDSLAVLDLASRVNQYFNLSDIGIEDYLLMKRSFADWTEILQAAFKHGVKRITFQTSGSTGKPKLCSHQVQHLHDEMNAFRTIFPKFNRVFTLVPPHHIYGFLFSVLYPDRENIKVIDARLKSPGYLKEVVTSSDLIVGTPVLLRYIQRSLGELPLLPCYLTSTAPMPLDQAQEIRGEGARRLYEIYGSSETSGLGVRDRDANYQVLPHLDVIEKDSAHCFSRKSADGEPILFSPPDDLQWEGTASFRPLKRLDGAVQIGGINVFPERVKKVFEELPIVEECAVRPTSNIDDDAAVRLKAFVVPSKQQDQQDSLIEQLKAHANKVLKDAERPINFTFGPEIPRNEMGKLSDW